MIDSVQSLFFFRFRVSSARAGERRSRETGETRAAAREEKRESLCFRAPPVSIARARRAPLLDPPLLTKVS